MWLVLWDNTILCNNFARWPQKIVAPSVAIKIARFRGPLPKEFEWVCVSTRGTRDYGMFDNDYESNLVLTFRCFVDIAHYVVQTSATRPIFGTNLRLWQFANRFNLGSRLPFLANCHKWRFVPKMGRVADVWSDVVACAPREYWNPGTFTRFLLNHFQLFKMI